MRRTMTGSGCAMRAIITAILLSLAGAAAAQQNTTYSYQNDAVGSLTHITDPLGLAFFFALVEPACAGATYAPVRVDLENILEVVYETVLEMQWEHTVTTTLDTDKNRSVV